MNAFDWMMEMHHMKYEAETKQEIRKASEKLKNHLMINASKEAYEEETKRLKDEIEKLKNDLNQ